jgi:hypothetical protein
MFKSYKNIQFASTTPYIFRTSNHKNIAKIMNPTDLKTFNFDPKTINWKTYLPDYYHGIKKYILKEIPQDPALMKAKITK